MGIRGGLVFTLEGNAVMNIFFFLTIYSPFNSVLFILLLRVINSYVLCKAFILYSY